MQLVLKRKQGQQHGIWAGWERQREADEKLEVVPEGKKENEGLPDPRNLQSNQRRSEDEGEDQE